MDDDFENEFNPFAEEGIALQPAPAQGQAWLTDGLQAPFHLSSHYICGCRSLSLTFVAMAPVTLARLHSAGYSRIYQLEHPATLIESILGFVPASHLKRAMLLFDALPCPTTDPRRPSPDSMGEATGAAQSIGAHIEPFACAHITGERDDWDGVDWMAQFGFFDSSQRCLGSEPVVKLGTTIDTFLQAFEGYWWLDAF